MPAFFDFSIAKCYLAEDISCTNLCACACTRTCIHTRTRNYLFLGSYLFIANSPSSSSFSYLYLNLKCPSQLPLKETSLHYFSIIRKAIKLTWKVPGSSQIFHCRHNLGHFVLYHQVLPTNSKYPKQPPHKYPACFSEEDWKNVFHTCSLHCLGPPKNLLLRVCPKIQTG